MLRHLLVDLENVQPSAESVRHWMGNEGKAWVFYGPTQHKLLPAFKALGDHLTLIPISRPGRNALDFHLVFYLGYLAAGHPKSQFVLLAKDKGYDAAVTHAQLLKFQVKRVTKLPGIPAVPASKPAKAVVKKPAVIAAKAPATSTNPRAEPAKVATGKKRPAVKTVTAVYRDVLTDLRGPNQPKGMAALRRMIQTRIGPTLAPVEVEKIVDRLKTTDAIQMVGGRLVYFAESAAT